MLHDHSLTYLYLVELRAGPTSDVNAKNPYAPDAAKGPRRPSGDPVIAADHFTRDIAVAFADAVTVDAVASDTLFIANPVLPERFRRNAPLTRKDEVRPHRGSPRQPATPVPRNAE